MSRIDWYEEPVTLYGLAKDLFLACSITCFLYALHRIARGALLNAQVAAYVELEEAYTPEEREVLVHKIKGESFRF